MLHASSLIIQALSLMFLDNSFVVLMYSRMLRGSQGSELPTVAACFLQAYWRTWEQSANLSDIRWISQIVLVVKFNSWR